MSDSPRHSRGERVLFWLVGKLGKWLIRLLASTARYRGPQARWRPELPDGHRHAVYAIWHHSLLLGVYRHRNQGIRVIISQSKDGEYLARIAHEMGFRTTRGSTTRGGARALMELRQKAEEDPGDIVFTVDGPKGPRHVVQQGALYLAQISGLPLVPAVYGMTRRWEVPSWDRFRIPKPFARVLHVYGEPMLVPKDSTREELEAIRQRLQDALCAMQDRADEHVKDPGVTR